jgi:hypothetical protein
MVRVGGDGVKQYPCRNCLWLSSFWVASRRLLSCIYIAVLLRL